MRMLVTFISVQNRSCGSQFFTMLAIHERTHVKTGKLQKFQPNGSWTDFFRPNARQNMVANIMAAFVVKGAHLIADH